MRARHTVLISLSAALAMSGCGSGGDSGNPATVSRLAYSEGSAIKAGMPRSAVRHRLGPPVLTSRPTGSAAGGCAYYAMQKQPLANVWQFCFDKGGRVNSGVTLYSISEPPPPADASPARSALLGRGDTICQGERADLAQPVKRLNHQLTALRRHPDPAKRHRAAALMGQFGEALEKTLSELSAFNPPSDERAALAGYLAALRGQIRVLRSARSALVSSQQQRYVGLIERFNALGDEATAQARHYGFAGCAGVTFS